MKNAHLHLKYNNNKISHDVTDENENFMRIYRKHNNFFLLFVNLNSSYKFYLFLNFYF